MGATCELSIGSLSSVSRGSSLSGFECSSNALALGDADDSAVVRKLNGLERGAVEPLMQFAF
jgi:hypothetical protein